MTNTYALKQPLLGFEGITVKEVLQHLEDNCITGKIHVDKWENALNKPWDPEDHVCEFI